MMNKFGAFLRRRDSFGHPVKLLYKGNETHNTIIGGILSVLVQGMTLVMMITAITELVLMKEPKISSFDKPLTTDDRKSIVPINFEEFDYVIAIQI